LILRLRPLILFILLSTFFGTARVLSAAPLCRAAVNGIVGPEIKLLLDPEKSFLTKLAAINGAQVSIDISYYILVGNDKSGKLLLAALQAAVRRGVDVRLIIDDYGSRQRNEANIQKLNLESSLGTVKIVIANPRRRYTTILRHLLSLALRRPIASSEISGNNRAHDKIIIVDSKLAILGGRNIGDLYSDLGVHRGRASEDFEIAIRDQGEEGGAIQKLLLHFEVLFKYSENLVLPKPVLRKKQLLAEDLYEEALKIIREEELEAKMKEIKNPLMGEGFQPSQVEVVSDARNLVKSRKTFEDDAWTLNSVRSSIPRRFLEAKSLIQIISPFLILSPQDIHRIGRFLRARPDIRLELYTNSINSDSIVTQAYHDHDVAPALMKLGEDPAIGSRLSLYSYMPKPQTGSVILVKRIHGKGIFIDGAEALVTSSNLNHRSFETNSELGLWVKLEATEAKELTDRLQAIREDSDLWGSVEWRKKREDPLFRTKIIMQGWIYKVVKFLNLWSTL
jgi:cardiolipin synthase C